MKSRSRSGWMLTMNASIASYLDASILVTTGIVLAMWKTQFGLNAWWVGALSTLVTLSVALGSAVGGYLSDKFGRVTVFNLDILFVALGTLLVALAPNLPMIVVGLFIAGVASGADLPTSLAVISERTEPDQYGKVIASTEIYWLGGIVLSQGLGFLTADMGYMSSRILFAWLAVVALVTWGIRALSPKFHNLETQMVVPVERRASTEEEVAAEKTDSKVSDEKIDDEKEIKAKVAAKDSASDVKEKSDASDAVKKAGKEAKDVKKDKKLSEKDFSRLEELAKDNSDSADNVKLSAAAQNLAKTENSKTVKSEESEDSAELKVLADVSSEIQSNQIEGDKKSETSDFDFSGKKDEGKKQFALDKDGKITVEDQRTKPESEREIADAKKSAVKTSEIKLTNENTAVMSVELNPNAEADVLSLNTQTAASNGSNFQAMLSNQLHNVAPEFVKAGNLILKDNNQGTINLVLHPDDLGNVKIHLSLDGKTLSGHITVATKEALQVFKDNAETLREAFIKNGFDAASFDVAMNNGGSFNQNMGFTGQDDGTSLFAKRAYGNSAGGLSAELDDIFENAEDISNYSVNIVA